MEKDDNHGVFKTTLNDVKEYIDANIQYVKLELTQKITLTVSNIMLWSTIGVLALFFQLFLSVALGLWLGRILANVVIGMAIVAVLYAFLILMVFIFRKQIFMNPTLRSVVKIFFDDAQQDKHK